MKHLCILTRQSRLEAAKRMFWLMMLFASVSLAHALAPAAASHKTHAKKTAYVSFVNACTTDLQEAWRASADIIFKGAHLATDLRIGENSLLRPVESGGQGVIEIRRHGTEQVLAQIPASLQPGTFTTVVLSGLIGTKSDVKETVLRDYPLDDSQKRAGFARLVLLTTITGYPTRMSVGRESMTTLPPVSSTVQFLRPGEKEIKMFFKDKRLGDRELHTSSGVLAKDGGNYDVIVFDSPRVPGRPNVLVIDVDLQRKELLESLAADQPAAMEDSSKTRR